MEAWPRLRSPPPLTSLEDVVPEVPASLPLLLFGELPPSTTQPQGPLLGPLIFACFLLPLGFPRPLSSVQTALRLPNSGDVAVFSQSQNEVRSKSHTRRALLLC